MSVELATEGGSMNFNALNGVEAQAYILRRVGEALSGCGEFPPNLTLPWFRFEFNLKVSRLTGLAEAPQVEKVLPLTVVEVYDEAGIPVDPEELETVELEGGEEIAVPDLARIASDQPIHAEKTTETGHKVDGVKLVKKKAARGGPWQGEAE